MNKAKVKARPKRDKNLTVRITNEQFDWIKQNKFSATAIFNEALKELGYQE